MIEELNFVSSIFQKNYKKIKSLTMTQALRTLITLK